MEVSGRVKMIGEPQQVSASFRKREIVVTTEEQYPQHILVEFTQDKCDLLNGFQVGEPVRVSINLRGREWTNPQGETRYFNSIQGWRIDRAGQQAPQGQPAYGAPQGYGQPQGGYNQAPQQAYGQPQQGGYNQAPQQAYGQPQQGGFNQAPQNNFNQNPGGFPPAPDFGNNEEPDDLPF